MLTHFGSPTGAAGAASCVAADPTHEARLQQLLSPGVQTVQLLHDAWDETSHFNVLTPFPGKWQQRWLKHNARLMRSDQPNHIQMGNDKCRHYNKSNCSPLFRFTLLYRQLCKGVRVRVQHEAILKICQWGLLHLTLKANLKLFPANTSKQALKQRGGLVLWQEINTRVCVTHKTTYKLYQYRSPIINIHLVQTAG